MDICNSGHLQIQILNDAKATSIASLRRRWWAQMLLGNAHVSWDPMSTPSRHGCGWWGWCCGFNSLKNNRYQFCSNSSRSCLRQSLRLRTPSSFIHCWSQQPWSVSGYLWDYQCGLFRTPKIIDAWVSFSNQLNAILHGRWNMMRTVLWLDYFRIARENEHCRCYTPNFCTFFYMGMDGHHWTSINRRLFWGWQHGYPNRRPKNCWDPPDGDAMPCADSQELLMVDKLPPCLP